MRPDVAKTLVVLTLILTKSFNNTFVYFDFYLFVRKKTLFH